MVSILQGELAQTITEALLDANVPFDIIVRRTTTVPGPEPWDPPVETTTTYPCRGWVENYDDDTVTGTLIDARDVQVMILTTSIAVEPTDTDTITIEGRELSIVNVKHDASGVLFIIQARA